MGMPTQDSPFSEWARWYVQERGMAVVHMAPRTKSPTYDGWNKPGGYFTDADQAEAWWTKHPNHNMGVVLGPSRVCSLDVDHVEYCRQVFSDVLGIKLDDLAAVYPTLVGNPARFRIMFKVPEGLEFSRHSLSWPNPLDPDGSKHKLATAALKQARDTNDKAQIEAMQARQKEFAPVTVFELRAGAVQDVLPPSIHPDTGQRYHWRNPPSDGLLDLPSDLVKTWQNWDIFKRTALEACPWAPAATKPPAKVKKSSPPRLPAGEHPSVIDSFNRATDIESLLQRHGYIKRGRKWLAPQSSTGLPGVNVVDEQGEQRLYSHHGSDPLANGHMNDAFDVFCILEHNGDTSAAIKAAARSLGIEHKRSGPRPPEPPPVGDLPPAPSGEDAAAAAPASEGGGERAWSAERVFQRFALVEGKTNVYDQFTRSIMKKNAFEALVTKALAKEWMDSPTKRVIAEGQAERLASQAKLEGKAKKADTPGMLPAERYVYLDGSQDVWDRQLRQRLPARAVQLALGDAFTLWLNSTDRQVIPAVNLVFDPRMTKSTDEYINTFEGLPLAPLEDAERCAGIVRMLKFLCNGDEDAVHWLTSWLAYPLQHLGAKMDTAVLLHSTMEGSGKSFLLSDIMREIYGDYGATVGQGQLDSSWTVWQSNKLYGVFEEVVSRDQRYNQVGKIKHMVTGKTVRIESKFVNGWEEANYMNAVFLSNEIMPWPISEHDRRMFVMWPEETLDPRLQKRVAWEIANGGIEAFYHYLLSFALGDFDQRTRPPKTKARQRLVELSRTSWESFLVQWRAGYLGVPFDVALTSDIHDLFVEWCSVNREHSMTATKLSCFLSTQVEKPDQQIHWYDDFGKRRFSMFFMPSPPPNLNAGDAKAMGALVKAFRDRAAEAGWNPAKWEKCKGWAEPFKGAGNVAA